jgi:PleD family two-component response regulator
MTTANGVPPIILVAIGPGGSLASALNREQYTVLEAQSGALALEWARDIMPDTIILDANLPDLPAIEACRLLRDDLRVGHNVPVLILSPQPPTPEQRVAALRAGAWDFLRYPNGPDELTLKLQTYVQAKRNIDIALADGLVDPETGLHNRHSLARRARELGALMARRHGSLACVVFGLEADARDSRLGAALSRGARVSDVVGRLGPTELAILAPATAHAGAVRLAQRAAGPLREVLRAAQSAGAEVRLEAGYAAVANLGYTPIDPVDLLARAAHAVRAGEPEPDCPWVRRFDNGFSHAPPEAARPRVTPPGVAAPARRTLT